MCKIFSFTVSCSARLSSSLSTNTFYISAAKLLCSSWMCRSLSCCCSASMPLYIPIWSSKDLVVVSNSTSNCLIFSCCIVFDISSSLTRLRYSSILLVVLGGWRSDPVITFRPLSGLFRCCSFFPPKHGLKLSLKFNWQVLLKLPSVRSTKLSSSSNISND